MPLSVIRAEKQVQLTQCLAVRRAVFTVERGIPQSIEKDGLDELRDDCDHYLIIADGVTVGAFRSVFIDPTTVKLQRLCILSAYRGMHFGAQALAEFEKACRERGIKKIVLDAQYPVRGFYQDSGYVITSDVFLEAEIPHVNMEKTL